MDLHGVHHLTAVSASIRENLRFYTRVMGMRLVKRSVNQDDTSAYHLFYADAVGTPGTDLTFFDWPMPREQRGTHSIVRTCLRVNGRESLDWWSARLDELGVAHGGVIERDDRLMLDLEDPEGQRLSLVDDGGKGDEPTPWRESPVPVEHQIRGLGPIVMSVPDIRRTEPILARVMGMEHTREYTSPDGEPHSVHVFSMHGDGPHAELHVAVQPDLPFARLGAGGVHHVAFRTPT
ncbi:MAG TPA: VOC family protein, partial [Rhodothermia bacterium]|nr:VOC family protein [Rhodothermia bacterium]